MRATAIALPLLAIVAFEASVSRGAPVTGETSIPPAPVARVKRPVYQPKNRTALKMNAKPKQSHVARSIFDNLSGLSDLSAPAPDTVPAEQGAIPHSALLQSLKILPDEDGDGLVDLQGQLKLLQDGELLDLTGRVKVGDLLDACVEVELGDGSGRKRLDCPSRNNDDGGLTLPDHKVRISKAKNHDDDEHRRCSKYLKGYHAHHGTKSYAIKLKEALRRIRELERELAACRGDDLRSIYQGIKTVSTKPDNDDWAPTRTHHHEKNVDDDNDVRQPSQKVRIGGDPHQHDETCKHKNHARVGTKDNGEVIWADVCVDAEVSMGPVYASAHASATANVDVLKLSASATATAHARVKVDGIADVDSKTSVDAKAELNKGQVDVNADEKLKLKLLNETVVDTDVQAKVSLGKPCPEGSAMNTLGICVAVYNDHKPLLSGLGPLRVRMRQVRRRP